MLSRIRNVERFAWFVAGLGVATIVAAAEEPRVWLERMNHALTERNYDGVFSHWQGGRVEMLRIIHRLQDGEVTERLVSLDGSGREFIRSGTELACYLPDARKVLVERRPESKPLLGNFPSFDEASAAVYDIQELKRTRFNRRDTRVISVTPRDEFRYGYRLWIDESSAMPLKSQLCDRRGHVIEQVVFSSLLLQPRIPNAAFRPDVATDGFQWIRTERDPLREQVSTPVITWSALKLPPGFRLTVRSAQMMPGSANPVSHLVFTDGLASVSVFVESQAVPGAAAAPSGAARVGSSSAFSTVIDGHKVTAFGEVPPATVRFIANSLKSAPGAAALQSPRP